MNIALIYPPTCDPTAPYLSLPTLTGYLRANGVEVWPIDANCEAYSRLLSRGSLTTLAGRVEERWSKLKRKSVMTHAEQLAAAMLWEARGDAHDAPGAIDANQRSRDDDIVDRSTARAGARDVARDEIADRFGGGNKRLAKIRAPGALEVDLYVVLAGIRDVRIAADILTRCGPRSAGTWPRSGSGGGRGAGRTGRPRPMSRCRRRRAPMRAHTEARCGCR